MSNKKNIIRYVVINGDEIPASYSTEMGQDVAYAYAKQNARRYGGKIFSVDSKDEMLEVDFRIKR